MKEFFNTLTPFRHSNEAISTTLHPPILGRISQTGTARGFAHAPCCALQPLVACDTRDEVLG
jgi:hypothetical protein